MRSLLAVLVLAASAFVPGPGQAPVAAADWHDGPCAPDDAVGVTVVVDFQELGGGVNVRCTGRSPSDGADALDAAGIAWQGVVRWGRGFVCRIAGKPADDPCIDTPPASAYWGYWIAPRGGSWCYSDKGVLNRRPPPGGVEGWSFSLDRDGSTSPPPRVIPPTAAPGAPTGAPPSGDCDPTGGTVPTTTTTTAPPAPTSDRPGSGTATPRPGDDPPSAPSTGPDGSPVPTTTTPEGSTTTTSAPNTTTTTTEADATTSSTAADDADRPRRTDERVAGAPNPTDLSVDGQPDEDGFPVSTAAGAGVVAALAVTGAVIARRRRTTA